MADQLYLSLWLRGFTENNLLRHFEKMLRTFPHSLQAKHGGILRIYGIEFSEPILLEEAFPIPVDLDRILEICKEFQHADCAYQMEVWWDLWQLDEEWKLAPARVTMTCFGPEFKNETSEHLRIDFGLDELFLPQPDLPGSARTVQENIKSLLRLVHDLDNTLNPEKRQLWVESGENFAERLEAALEEAG
jgi:hypothetical protein